MRYPLPKDAVPSDEWLSAREVHEKPARGSVKDDEALDVEEGVVAMLPAPVAKGKAAKAKAAGKPKAKAAGEPKAKAAGKGKPADPVEPDKDSSSSSSTSSDSSSTSSSSD